MSDTIDERTAWSLVRAVPLGRAGRASPARVHHDRNPDVWLQVDPSGQWTASGEVADALVRHGLATRSSDRSLRGSTVVSAVRREQAVPAPRPEVRGWCASTHHVEPVRAVVEGRRGRSQDDPWAEDVRLCGRCADLLGEAGFFTAA